jgi:hypothetical protein
VDAGRAGQVRPRLGQMVRAGRDPTDHWLTGLGPFPASRRRVLSFPLGLLQTMQPLGDFFGCGADLLHPLATVPQLRRHPVTDISSVGGVLGGIHAVGLGRIEATSRSSHCWLRLVSIHALAAIFVPSIATVPNRASPARPATNST